MNKREKRTYLSNDGSSWILLIIVKIEIILQCLKRFLRKEYFQWKYLTCRSFKWPNLLISGPVWRPGTDPIKWTLKRSKWSFFSPFGDFVETHLTLLKSCSSMVLCQNCNCLTRYRSMYSSKSFFKFVFNSSPPVIFGQIGLIQILKKSKANILFLFSPHPNQNTLEFFVSNLAKLNSRYEWPAESQFHTRETSFSYDVYQREYSKELNIIQFVDRVNIELSWNDYLLENRHE